MTVKIQQDGYGSERRTGTNGAPVNEWDVFRMNGRVRGELVSTIRTHDGELTLTEAGQISRRIDHVVAQDILKVRAAAEIPVESSIAHVMGCLLRVAELHKTNSVQLHRLHGAYLKLHDAAVADGIRTNSLPAWVLS